MVDIEKLKKEVMKYNLEEKKNAPDYTINRNRLCRLVDEYGPEATAIATGLAETTVYQHYRNCRGTAMISSHRLDRAETVLFKL
jgi:hypothetical protein